MSACHNRLQEFNHSSHTINLQQTTMQTFSQKYGNSPLLKKGSCIKLKKTVAKGKDTHCVQLVLLQKN